MKFLSHVTTEGQIESTATGFKFPDTTVQTTAARRGGGIVAADRGFALGAGFEREASGLIVSKGLTIFSRTQADALTTPPSGWTWRNESKLTAASTNSAKAKRLVMVHDGAQTSDFFYNAHSLASLYREVDAPDAEFIARIHKTDGQAVAGSNITAAVVQPHYESAINLGYVRVVIGSDGTFAADSSCVGTSSQSRVTLPKLSAGELSTGVWVRFSKRGRDVTVAYALDDQATPPTAWTRVTWALATPNVGKIRGADRFWLMLGVYRYNDTAASTPTLEVSYYRERLGPSLAAGRDGWEFGSADGFDGGGDLALVSSFDLGSDAATVDTASLRAALAAAVNRRSLDSATWTFSAVRAAGTPSSGTFSSAGAVTVEGSGRYLSVWARATLATRLDRGSLDPREVCFRYSP